MGGLLHLARRGLGGATALAPPGCTECTSPPINGQSTSHHIAVYWSIALWFYNVPIEGLTRTCECCALLMLPLS